MAEHDRPRCVLSVGSAVEHSVFSRVINCDRVAAAPALIEEHDCELAVIRATAFGEGFGEQRTLSAINLQCPLILMGVSTASRLSGFADLCVDTLHADNVEAVWQEVRARWYRQREQRVAAAVDAVGQLAGGTAHDLNNVLMVVLGNLELVGLSTEDEALRDLVVAAENAGQRGVFMARRLSNFTNRDEDLKTCYLNDLVGEFVERHRDEHATTHELQAIFEAVRDDTVARIRVGRVERILSNLIDNAREAMPGGGRIDIVTSAEAVLMREETCQIIGGEAPPRYFSISVRDRGEGMEGTVLRRAGELFFSTRQKGRAGGVGLAVAGAYAAGEGGAILLASAPGEGTQAHLLLPLDDGIQRDAGSGR